MEVEKLMDALRDEKTGASALKILGIISYFASEEIIQTRMFFSLMNDSGELETALELLKRHSLIQPGDKETKICIEKTIQTGVQKVLKEREQEEATLKLALKLLGKFLDPVILDNFDHAISVFAFAKEYPKLVEEDNEFPNSVVRGLMKLDRDAEAASFGHEAFDVLKGSVGEYHPSTRALQRSLGGALLCADETEEALKLLIELYERESEISGRREITDTLSLIGKAMAVIPEPEMRLRQLVFGKVSVSETNNNSVLNTWNEYALMLPDLKWSDEALQILRQVIKKRQELLRPDDDDICEARDSIARVYLKQKNFTKALEIFQNVYGSRKTNLGENSTKTLLTRRGIAEVFQSQEMYDKALTEYEELAEKYRKVLGESSLLYFTTRSNLAHILHLQNENEKSYLIYSENYQKHSAVFGEKSTRSLTLKYNMASVLYEQNKIDEALKIWEEVLEAYFSILGPEDPETKELLYKVSMIQLILGLKDI